MPAAGKSRLSGRRQVYFCYANDSTVARICGVQAVLERRLLNEGVGGEGERKDHVSQSASWEKKVDFSSPTSAAAIPVFLCLISFCFS